MTNRGRGAPRTELPVALTVAGSDSGGGAGVQGDLRTFARWGVYGTSAITAITAQNTQRVVAWEPVSPSLVRAQIDAIFADLPPAAVKTGMLGALDVTRAVIDSLAAHRPQHLVVDPVLIATSGDSLADPEVLSVMRDSLLPLATLVTPNLDEAGALLGARPGTEDDMRDAARDIVTRFGARAALVKGGHAETGDIQDVLYDGDWTIIRHRRVASSNTHGTGCALSAAITAQLARGQALRPSVSAAIEWIIHAIESAPVLGAGRSPLNHSAEIPSSSDVGGC